MWASFADDVVLPAPFGPNIRNNTGVELEACSVKRAGRGLDDARRERAACKTNVRKDVSTATIRKGGGEYERVPSLLE